MTLLNLSTVLLCVYFQAEELYWMGVSAEQSGDVVSGEPVRGWVGCIASNNECQIITECSNNV